MDHRIAEFIENSVKIQSVQEQVKSHDNEIERLRKGMERAHTRIDKMGDSIATLEGAPAKNTHATVNHIKSTIIGGLCGIAVTGLGGLIIWLISSYMQRG